MTLKKHMETDKGNLKICMKLYEITQTESTDTILLSEAGAAIRKITSGITKRHGRSSGRLLDSLCFKHGS